MRKIQENQSLKKGPIICLTNLNSEHVIREAFKLGTDGYLIKSKVMPDKVVEEVNKFLGVKAVWTIKLKFEVKEGPRALLKVRVNTRGLFLVNSPVERLGK